MEGEGRNYMCGLVGRMTLDKIKCVLVLCVCEGEGERQGVVSVGV